MKQLLLNLLGAFSPLFSQKSLIQLSGAQLFFPVYHLSADHRTPHIDAIYPVRNLKTFEADMDYLLKHFQPIGLPDLMAHLTGREELKGNCFHLTFDDGLKEIYHDVAPILKRKGIPATVFINSDFLDNKDLFYRYKASLLVSLIQSLKEFPKDLDGFKNLRGLTGTIKTSGDLSTFLMSVKYDEQKILDDIANILQVDFDEFLADYQPYLTSSQVKTLISDGFTIGAHSKNHPEYRFISLEEQLTQTQDCMDVLERKFDLNYRTFAFPFTDFGVSKAFFDEILYPKSPDQAFDVSFGSAGIKQDLYANHLHRFPMEGTQLSAASLIKREYLYYLLKVPFGKNRIRRE